MNAHDLVSKRCRPCEKGAQPLSDKEIAPYLKQISGWNLIEAHKIQKKIRFQNFSELMKFVNRMAELAEREGHHPDFSVSYNRLTVTLWTHTLYGLSENDFILAAQIDRLLRESGVS